MLQYSRFKLPVSPKKGGGGFHRVLVVLGVAFFGWVWWHTGSSLTPAPTANPPPPSPRAPATNPAATKPLSGPTNPVAKPVPLITRAGPGTVATKINAPNVGTVSAARRAQNVFETQLALARQGISSGSLDGVAGPQTRAALRAFQLREHLPATGDLDGETKARIALPAPAYARYAITTNDLARLQPLSPTWLGKSQQTALDYETILELVAEQAHAHPSFIRHLNPGLDWTNILAGTTVQIPNAPFPAARVKAAFIKIQLQNKTLQAFDARTNLLAHFPCSIAKRVEKRPVGELHVAVIAPNPNYTFNPEVFPESAEARQLQRRLVLPPGPNNPVGTAWIGLDKPGYGIHGTPRPEEVGRTESHGCFRLANWNAELLLRLVSIGTPVEVEP